MRLFVALWPDPAIRHRLAEWRDGWTWPRAATPVRTERLHVTVHFLGEIGSERVPDLGEALRVPFKPFRLQFGRPELWPHGIAVLAPEAIPEPLLELHASLSGALRRVDVPLDSRTYRPHVTLARRAGNAIPASNGPAIEWPVEDYRLMESTPGPGGGYTTLRHYEP